MHVRWTGASVTVCGRLRETGQVTDFDGTIGAEMIARGFAVALLDEQAAESEKKFERLVTEFIPIVTETQLAPVPDTDEQSEE